MQVSSSRASTRRVAAMSTLGQLISQKRQEKRLSLRQLAEQVGLSHQTIYNVEAGQAPWGTAVKVAKALGVPTGVLERLVRQSTMALVRSA